MARASLAAYDGSTAVLVDTSVWVDCIDESSPWHAWAIEQLQTCSERAPIHVNLIIYTQLLVPGPDVAVLDALLDVYSAARMALGESPWSSRCVSTRSSASSGSSRRWPSSGTGAQPSRAPPWRGLTGPAPGHTHGP